MASLLWACLATQFQEQKEKTISQTCVRYGSGGRVELGFGTLVIKTDGESKG